MKKIKRYKGQDRDGKRDISKDNYVTAEWLMKAVKKPCSCCGSDFYISCDTGNVNSNITADRIDNSIGHSLDNIVPMCKFCNCCKSNK